MTTYVQFEGNNDPHIHHSHQEHCVTASGSGRKIALRDFFTVLALSFHSVFEGLAIGLEEGLTNVWLLFAGKNLYNFLKFCHHVINISIIISPFKL